jgi:hypothetical protein
MINFVTYASNEINYQRAKTRIMDEARDFGIFDNMTCYGRDTLSKDFVTQFEDVLSLKRGGGYWIWKLDILQHEMSKVNDGDFIVYADVGCSFNNCDIAKQRMSEYLKLLNESPYGVLIFQTDHKEFHFTTKEIFNHFNVDITSPIATSGQYAATVIILQKNNHSKAWLQALLSTLSDNRWLFTDIYNKNQHNAFRDNRHDQSIISVYTKLNGGVILSDENYDKALWGIDRSKGWPIWSTRYK